MKTRRRYGTYHFLSEKELTTIHEASLKILETNGVHAPDERLLKLAESKGAKVNFSSSVIRFPKRLTEQYLAENRLAFEKAGRGGSSIPNEDERRVCFHLSGQSIRSIDLETGDARRATLKDLEDSSKIASYLNEVQFNGALYHPTDVPQRTDDLYQYYTMVKHTTKPVLLDIIHVSSIPWLEEMAIAVHGSKKIVQAKNILYFNAFISSPLQYAKDALQKMWAVYDRGYKVSLGWPMSVVGASTPVTLAGAAVSCNADAVSGIVLTRMIDSNVIARLGASPVTMDMHSGMGLYGDPRRLLLCGACMDMSRFYGIPTGNFPVGIDAAFPGIQAAMERMFTSMTVLAYGEGDIPIRLGILGPANAAASMAQIFIDLEIGHIIEKWLQGIEVSDDTLALQDILDAGIGGSFLAHEHTARFFRRECWLPELVEHRVPAGKLPPADPVYEKARVKARQILAQDDLQALRPDVKKELDRIMESALKAIKIN